MTGPFEQINFHARDWALMKQYLEDQMKVALDVMCNPRTDHDETNQLRGRILFIKSMLTRAENVQRDSAR